MPSWDDVAVGDTIEWSRIGVVKHVRGSRNTGTVYDLVDGRIVFSRGCTLESVKKPVRTFQSGDRVRSKEFNRFEYTIGTNGYFDHLNNCVNQGEDRFTSDVYELVD